MKQTNQLIGNYGQCHIGDCLDYMHTLSDQQFDLGFTDPPWGHKYNGKTPMGINAQVYKEEIINYDDQFNPIWNHLWFTELTRVCKRVVIAMGWRHFNWWVANTDPRGYFFLTFKNGQGSTKVCKHNAVHPFLCYGDAFRDRKKKFHWNFLDTYIPNGFLRGTYKFIHPSPKPFQDWYKMISELHPDSLFDPFAGTCTIGEVGEALRIPWEGVELNKDYSKDIQYRIRCGMTYKQTTQQKLM